MRDRYENGFRADEILIHERILDGLRQGQFHLAAVLQPSRSSPRMAYKVWMLGQNLPGLGSCVWNAFYQFGLCPAQGIQCLTHQESHFVWSQHFLKYPKIEKTRSRMWATKGLLQELANLAFNVTSQKMSWKMLKRWGSPDRHLAVLLPAAESLPNSVQALQDQPPKFNSIRESFELNELPDRYLQHLNVRDSSQLRAPLLEHLNQFISPKYYAGNFRPDEAFIHKFALDKVIRPHAKGVLCVSARDSRSDKNRVKLWVIGTSGRGFVGTSVQEAARCLWRAFNRLGDINAGDGVQFVTKTNKEFVWSQHFRKDDIYRVLDKSERTTASKLLVRALQKQLRSIVPKELGWKLESLPNVDTPELFYLTNGKATHISSAAKELAGEISSPKDWTRMSDTSRMPSMGRASIGFGPETSKVLDALGSSRARQIFCRVAKSHEPVIARQLAKELGITDASICVHLKRLEDAGLISRTEQMTPGRRISLGIVAHTDVVKRRLQEAIAALR